MQSKKLKQSLIGHLIICTVRISYHRQSAMKRIEGGDGICFYNQKLAYTKELLELMKTTVNAGKLSENSKKSLSMDIWKYIL